MTEDQRETVWKIAFFVMLLALFVQMLAVFVCLLLNKSEQRAEKGDHAYEQTQDGNSKSNISDEISAPLSSFRVAPVFSEGGLGPIGILPGIEKHLLMPPFAGRESLVCIHKSNNYKEIRRGKA